MKKEMLIRKIVAAGTIIGMITIIKNKGKIKEKLDWNKFKKKNKNIKVDEIILD